MKIYKIVFGSFFLVSSIYTMEPPRKKIKLVDFERITWDQRNLNENLLEAVENGDIKEIKELLERGANINATNEGGTTVLMKATWRNNIKIVRLLLENGVNVNAPTRGKDTALMKAVLENESKIVQLLLKFGADVNAQNILGGTALIVATFLAKTEIVKMLLKSGADIQVTCKAGFTVLAFAVEELGRLKLFIKFLSQKLNKPHVPELIEFIDIDIKNALKKMDLTHSSSIESLKDLHLFARRYPKEFPGLEKEINKLISLALTHQPAEKKEMKFKEVIKYQRTLRS